MARLEVDALTDLGHGGLVPPPPVPSGRPRPAGPRRSRRLQGVGWLMLVLARLLWPLSPAAAAPAVTVTPSTGITDGQNLTVAYTGFSPNVTVQITECEVGATAYDQCDFIAQVSQLGDGAGSGSVTFVARRLPDDAFPGAITCDAANPCEVTVFEETDTFTPRASAKISFAAGENSPTTTTTAAVTTTTGAGVTTTTLAGTTSTTSAGGNTSTTLSGVTTTSVAAGGSGGSTSTTSTTSGSGGSTTTSTTTAGGTTTSTSAIGGVVSPGAADTSSDALAFTGTSLIAPLLALTGALMIAVGIAVRSRSASK